jgi:tetratricopeptide (TPR) repeat protein
MGAVFFTPRLLGTLLAGVGAATLAVAQSSRVGDVTFPNSGAPAAQESFLTGLAQLHNFEYPSAAEHFQKAQQADPGFAMAYWGEAMAYTHPVWMEQDRDAARNVLARLAPTPDARIAKARTKREQDYLRAVEVLYGDGAKAARDFAYADAMAAIHRAYPDDPDAAAFYALSLLGTAHNGRDFTIYMKAASIVEPVFRDHPNHPGAAHYLIHSYDDPVHAPLGLRAARAYSKIAPSAAHAQHMTSHIFLALGMWDDEVTANETAVKVADQARATRGLPASACGHYNFWLEYGYLQQRRFNEAKRLVTECHAAARRSAAAVPPAQGTQLLDPDNSLVGSFAAMRLRYLLDTQDWTSDVAGWTIETNGQWRSQIAFEFGTGYSAALSGQRADATRALERLSQARRSLDAALVRSTEGSGHGSHAPENAETQAREWARILEMQLTAVTQSGLAKGGEAGIETLRGAAAAEEKMPYEFGPPAIDKPSYELLGEALLSMKRPVDASAAFEKALARAPERTASLRGLMLAADASGDARKAAEIRARLKSIWHRADQMPGDLR